MGEEFRDSLEAETVRERALEHLAPLFSNPTQAQKQLRELPVAFSCASRRGWSWIEVPEWAHWVVPEKYGALFVPSFGDFSSFEDYPWWRAIDSYIGLDQEASRERNLPPIHSYSTALGNEGSPAFEFAWVNRIAAFLKAWSSKREGRKVEELFGPLPLPKITLTHDVDALEMTTWLKIKQAVNRVSSGDFGAAIRILLVKTQDPFLETLIDLERKLGIQSVWLIFVRAGEGANKNRHFLDPEYSTDHPRLRWLLSQLIDAHHAVGLHSSFRSWNNNELLSKEKKLLQGLLNREPRDIRQHWLRFGATITWSVQSKAGFARDFTLGFNDRAGFRASTALPLNPEAGNISAIPTVVMDSNLFGRGFRQRSKRIELIDQLMDEVADYGGHVAINWHPHTLGSAYGWLETYEYLLSAIRARRLEVVT